LHSILSAKLLPIAPVEKKLMPGKSLLLPVGGVLKPWQLVDQNGDRSFYRCTH
jgi:hypothetical protein